MRNLIWSGTALVLLAGAGMFVAGQHAVRHPDSFLGRCATTLYHMCDAALVPPGAPKTAEDLAQAPLEPPTMSRSVPAPEVMETIVVEETDSEPPPGSPRLSPEVAAAIERLRSEEESEAPPRAFDGPVLYMPYADEDVQVAPASAAAPVLLEPEVSLPGSHGFFILPPGCWQMVLDKVMASLLRHGQEQDGLEEPADRGTSDDEFILPPTTFQNYHSQSCPYTGSYPSSYRSGFERPSILPSIPEPIAAPRPE
jgi:hypothetical protein